MLVRFDDTRWLRVFDPSYRRADQLQAGPTKNKDSYSSCQSLNGMRWFFCSVENISGSLWKHAYRVNNE